MDVKFKLMDRSYQFSTDSITNDTELYDDRENLILIFSKVGVVKNCNGRIGNFHLEYTEPHNFNDAGIWVYYELPIQTRTVLSKQFNLALEMIARRYLSGEREVKVDYRRRKGDYQPEVRP